MKNEIKNLKGYIRVLRQRLKNCFDSEGKASINLSKLKVQSARFLNLHYSFGSGKKTKTFFV